MITLHFLPAFSPARTTAARVTSLALAALALLPGEATSPATPSDTQDTASPGFFNIRRGQCFGPATGATAARAACQCEVSGAGEKGAR